ncbi:hypothetical protein ILUMI_03520 [Ignelater luminosus]|uniref:DUF5641 domain-containing protein n=1 Tax=Ignelater luminosus TaxID=2038154 RepID=A0A8K0GI91_IGNLU|nr:hypothetical protein ILUMI_03520 [Ignelater luminosus]
MYSRLLDSARIVGPFPSPIVLQTTLGFVVMGSPIETFISKFWELEEVPSASALSSDDVECPHYFIPPHGVPKPQSTSTRSSKRKSLNDILHAGPKLQTDIVTILINFRLFPIAITADLKKMYLQIVITLNHRNFQLLLWRFSPDDPLTPYRFNRVLFGNKSSPYLAIRTVRQLASVDSKSYSLASQAVSNNFYMDDFISSIENLPQAKKLYFELVGMFNAGGFQIVKWCSNSKEFLAEIPVEDCLAQPISFDDNAHNVLDWGSTPPSDIVTCWIRFCSEIPLLESLQIPRRLGVYKGVSVSLIGFADASRQGYGRTNIHHNSSKISLVCAKSKVAPIETVSVPRLELLRLNLVIDYTHRSYLHTGPDLIVSILRQKYWILAARSVVKQRLRQCNLCFKVSPRASYLLTADLPASRVAQAKPFVQTGIDYSGPFHVAFSRKRGIKTHKAYVCLFVCLASDLSTDSFLCAFNRFLACKGPCSGIWEAQNKSVKTHLRKVLGNNQILTYEEPSTILTQIEALLNSRPLGWLSSDPNDPAPLIPAHVLVAKPLKSLPAIDLTEQPINRLGRKQLLDQLTQSFSRRGHVEYLHTLQTRQKWNTSSCLVKHGMVVLLVEENARAKGDRRLVMAGYRWSQNIDKISYRNTDGGKKKLMGLSAVLAFTPLSEDGPNANGAIFTEDQRDSITELAFKYAVYKINRDKTILPYTSLEYDIRYVPRDDSFHASKKGIEESRLKCQMSGAVFRAGKQFIGAVARALDFIMVGLCVGYERSAVERECKVAGAINVQVPLKPDQEMEEATESFTKTIRRAAWSERISQKWWQETRAPNDKTKRTQTDAKRIHKSNYRILFGKTDYSLWKVTKKIKCIQWNSPLTRNGRGVWARSDLEKANTFDQHLADLPISTNIEMSTFADDTARMASHQNPQITFKILQNHFTKVQSWLKKWRIKATQSHISWLGMQNALCAHFFQNEEELEENFNGKRSEKSYLHGLVERRQPKTRRATTDKNSPLKQFGYDCFLPKTDGAKVRVRRKFMLYTLNITKDSFNRWVKIDNLQNSISDDDDQMQKLPKHSKAIRLKKAEAREAKKKAIDLASDNLLVATMDVQSIILCLKLLTLLCTCAITMMCKKIVLISDGCAYQNKNKVLSSALADLTKVTDIEIQQIILENGHTMM